MALGSILGPALGGIASGLFGSKGASDAADAQKWAAKKQLKFQKKAYNNTRKDFRPFLRAGRNALAGYQYELGLGPRPSGYQGIEASPAATFALEQGRDVIEGGAAGGGGLYSGATMKALEDHRLGTLLGDRDNQLNRLAGLLDVGMGAASGRAGASANFATGAGTAMANMGDAAASGAIGKANALTGGLNTGVQLWQLGQWAPQNTSTDYRSSMPNGGNVTGPMARPNGLGGGFPWS